MSLSSRTGRAQHTQATVQKAGSPVPSEDAQCPQCHERFSRTGNRQVYCSSACRMARYDASPKGKARYARKARYNASPKGKATQARYDLRRKLRDLGIDRDIYDGFLHDQDNRCGICRKPGTDKLRLAIDHNHVTGRVRGLLCRNCNSRVLPMFENDPGRAARLVEWLDR